MKNEKLKVKNNNSMTLMFTWKVIKCIQAELNFELFKNIN